MLSVKIKFIIAKTNKTIKLFLGLFRKEKKTKTAVKTAKLASKLGFAKVEKILLSKKAFQGKKSKFKKSH